MNVSTTGRLSKRSEDRPPDGEFGAIAQLGERLHGMQEVDGSIKTVNALSHYTDWTIGHVHAGALGWVAMISIGSLYHLIPKVFGRPQMHSIGLINAHFWLATIGTVLYIRRRQRQLDLHPVHADRQRHRGQRGGPGRRRQ